MENSTIFTARNSKGTGVPGRHTNPPDGIFFPYYYCAKGNLAAVFLFNRNWTFENGHIVDRKTRQC